MKKLLNFKNIAIAVLIIYLLLQWFNPGGVMPGGRTIRIDGKKYEVIKHTIDTVDVVKTKVVTKKDKIYNLNIGVNNRTTDGTNGSFSPYVGFGTYWKIKVKK